MNDSSTRETRWQELSRSECFGLLVRNHLGRLAFVDDLGPVIIPVNYVFDQHVVVIRTDEGTKLRAARKGAKVAFEIDGIDAAGGTGWSVLVRGEAAEVTDRAELERLGELSVNSLAPGGKPHYIRVLPALLTGRRILAPGEDGVTQWDAT